MWDPSISPIMWEIYEGPWAMTLNELDLEMTQKLFANEILPIIVFLATTCTSHTVHKISPIPSLCNDIATLLSIEIVSIICVFFPLQKWTNLLQIKLDVLWHTQALCLNIFSMNEPNNNLLLNFIFISLTHTLRWLAHLHIYKAGAQNRGICPFFVECQ